MRRQSYSIFLVLLVAFLQLLAPGAMAAGSETPKRDVRAGIFNFEGYHSRDDAGNLEGYGMDLLKLISEYSHLNFDYSGYDNSWKDMQEMLENGDIDIVSTARRTPQREEIFAFSLPVGRNHTILAKKLANSRLRAGDYATYNGIKIGVVSGSSQNRHLADFAKDKNFTYTIIEYESPLDLANALQVGDVDAILSSNLRKPENETLLDIIKSDNFYIIARKENQDLIDEINYAIEQMNLNEGDWQNDLYYRHYGPEAAKLLEFSSREDDYINSVRNGGKRISAIARRDLPPYSYVEDGVLKGILPDYFSRAMQMAGLPYQLIVPENSEDYIQKAENNEVDVVLDRLTPKPVTENDPHAGFTTDPYLITGLARVTRSDFNGPVRTLALPENIPLEFRPGLVGNLEIRQFPSAQDAMKAVQHGEADAAYVLPYTAQMFISREPGNNLLYAMMDDTGANFRMYVPETADHELITILKKSIKGLPAGTLYQLGSKYVSFNAGEMSLFSYLHANPEIMLTVGLALMLGTSLFLIVWLRGRWNRRLLATTEHANQELEGQLAIVEALSRDYSNVLGINADNGETSIIKITEGGSGQKSGNLEKGGKYAAIMANYMERVHPEDRAYLSGALSLAMVLDQLESKDEYSGTYRVLDNGEIQYFQFTFVRPYEKGETEDELILAGFRNIDDVIRREQKQQKVLAEALAQARYASAAKTAFLNNMSHDIRTPMNAIIGFTTLATSNVENVPMVKRYLGKIMTSSNHLLNLINDVLDMSRIESGKVKIEEQEVRLPQIFHELRTIVQADVKAKNFSFHIDTLNVSNETIFCDRLRLNQVLLNILSNAMKYTQAGGQVTVRVIQLTPAQDGMATYEFRIRDTGIGMSKEFLEHVFEPFEREQTSTVSGIQGTGLGLAITKNIVDMMGGVIDVKSQPGKGSEFTVTFRFRVLDEENAEKTLQRLAGSKALLVEGDMEAGESLKKMVADLGLQADWTISGGEALDHARDLVSRGGNLGACLLSWNLPDMDSLELVRQLRNIIPASTPIIILTPYDWTDLEEEGKQAGVSAFCSKPVFFSELRGILDNSLAEERTASEAAEEGEELFAGKRILLAEDNEMNQEIAQMILEDVGFELEIVENGQEAVDKMEAMPANTYDLILMDVQMPVMNGYEATRKIRQLEDPLKAGIPIIAMTANAFDEDREEAIHSGMNGYVPKPIDIGQLMQTLQSFFKKSDN